MRLDGREVRVDRNKLVFSVAWNYPLLEFKSPRNPCGEDFILLLADVGMRMQQVRQAERPEVSSTVLRYRSMVDIAVSQKAFTVLASQASSSSMHASPPPAPEELHVGVDQCAVCNKSYEPLVTCAFCTGTAHQRCLTHLRTLPDYNKRLAELQVCAVTLVSFFKDKICMICRDTHLIHTN